MYTEWKMRMISAFQLVLLTILLLKLHNGCCTNKSPKTLTLQNITLSSDVESQTLNVRWHLKGETNAAGKEIAFQIQVGWTKEKKNIFTDHFNTTFFKDRSFSWSWQSDFPLECTVYSVRIRTTEDESSTWSEWVDLEPASGTTEEVMIFPKEKTLPSGSTLNACCVHKENATAAIMFNSTPYPLINISSTAKAITVKKLPMVPYGSFNIDCTVSSPEEDPVHQGRHFFIIYPAETPRNLTCETQDLQKVTCSWNTGQFTKMPPAVQTKYCMSLSGKGMEKCFKENNGVFEVTPGQMVYNVTVKAINPLGEVEAHLSFNILERVYPPMLTDMSVHATGPRSLNVSWTLAGNLSALSLLCESELTTDHGKQILKNHTLDGGLNFVYTITLDGLCVYTSYSVRMHCAAAKHFWKWSKWSDPQVVQTGKYIPSAGPDIWREIKSSDKGRNVTLHWKYPDNSQTNGPIEYYNLTWTSLQGLPHTNSIIIRAENGIQHEKRLWFSNVSYIITIQAKNSEGWSPPSTLTVPSAAKGEINITRQIIKGTNEGFNLTWKPETLVTCGYTVEWRDRSNISSSGLHWAKFNSTAAVITSGNFRKGERYTFNIYGCTSAGDRALEIMTGYMQELSPTERPQIKHFRPQPHSVTLQWSFNEHSETNRGFILGYNICVKETSDITKATCKQIRNHEKNEYTFKGLQPMTKYRFDVSAFTAGGDGPCDSGTVTTPPFGSPGPLLGICLVPVLTALVLLLYFRKRIKNALCTSGDSEVKIEALKWDSGIYEISALIQSLKAEECNYSEIEVVKYEKEEKVLYCNLENTSTPQCCTKESPTKDAALDGCVNSLNINNLAYFWQNSTSYNQGAEDPFPASQSKFCSSQPRDDIALDYLPSP
ncbi:leukemia inhibitory factor receptor isoform X2 [Polypterus senegalus]|uniref:leukemia inhibitory factor receptor isoform X2 n=1 Tax=Polypterus senegalus TaxID=55291 RepID=UPI001962C432|nr:leukemia inhibitory factor receptor isoform X2 [Polypterus senegalus]